jgi:hypothetical protein
MTELHTYLFVLPQIYYRHIIQTGFSLFSIILIFHTDKRMLYNFKILLSSTSTQQYIFLAKPYYVQCALYSTMCMCMKDYDNILRLILNISHSTDLQC